MKPKQVVSIADRSASGKGRANASPAKCSAPESSDVATTARINPVGANARHMMPR